MTPPPTSKKREALFASQPIAASIGVLANEYAGHAIAALAMPMAGPLEDETVRRAKRLLDLSEDFARTLRRYLSADETSDAQTYVFTMTETEFVTVLAGFSATKALALLPIGEEAAAGTEKIAIRSSLPAPIADAEVLDLFAARLIATASRQHAGVK